MLCDQIANATLDEVRGRLNYINDPEAVDWVWRGFDRLRPKIKAAHKFMLDDPVALAAESVRLSRPTTIRDALDFCAPLFPTTWIEWSGGIVADRRQLSPGTMRPIRGGMLCESGIAEKLRRGIIHMFWSLPEPRKQICVSHCCAVFDFDRTLLPEMRKKYNAEVKNPMTLEEARRHLPHLRRVLTSEKEIEALEQSNDEAFLTPSVDVMGPETFDHLDGRGSIFASRQRSGIGAARSASCRAH